MPVAEVKKTKRWKSSSVNAFPCICGGSYHRVLDSRANEAGQIRRRRVCWNCGDRITTYEAAEKVSDYDDPTTWGPGAD